MTAASPSSRLPTASSLLLLPLLLLLHSCSATITISDSGQRFRSHADAHLGKPLWTGYDYYARLQTLPALFWNDTSLTCDAAVDKHHHHHTSLLVNLTVPPDGLPVALLVPGGGACTAKQKLQVLLQLVQPAPLLRFLIIGDDQNDLHDRMNSVLLKRQEGGGGGKVEESSGNGDEEAMQMQEEQDAQEFQRRLVQAINVDNDSSSNSNNSSDYPPTTVHVLHVTARVQAALLDEIKHQSPSSQLEGGLRVILDSAQGNGWIFQSSLALWLSIFVIGSACACTILVVVNNNVHQQYWAEELAREQAQQQQQQARRARRRLTREQVKKLLPQYRYDGENLYLIVDNQVVMWEKQQKERQQKQQQQQQQDDLSDIKQDVLLSSSLLLPSDDNNDDDHPHHPHHLCHHPRVLNMPLELDCCSVCLDDYEAGDKIRLLPCQHVFHSRCVGRWLAERSATCPLCKTELLPEEEEEERDQEEEERQTATATATTTRRDTVSDEDVGFWMRFFYGNSDEVVSQDELTDLLRQPQQPPDAAAAADVPARAVRSSSWWRRVLPSSRRRRRSNSGAENMLSEPLLDEETGQAQPPQEETMGAVGDGAILIQGAEEMVVREEPSALPPQDEEDQSPMTDHQESLHDEEAGLEESDHVSESQEASTISNIPVPMEGSPRQASV